MAGLNEDTFADKAVRFVIGAVLGAVSGFFYATHGLGATDAAYATTTLVFAGAVGVLAVVFGNSFIEGVIKRQWWD